jgi:large subunit ribosomal protein L17
MRHRKNKGRLSRRTSWRKATLKSMANDLLRYQRIETTFAKAKALQVYIEPIITAAKKDLNSVSGRRVAFQKLCNRDMVKCLFEEIAPLFVDIQGGYTRVIASGNRKGDGARTAIVEFTKRTIPDDKLLGIKPKKEKVKKVKETKEKKEDLSKQVKHSAPEVSDQEKEKRTVEDVKKEKAKTEQQKVAKRGIFKRFQRKSMG